MTANAFIDSYLKLEEEKKYKLIYIMWIIFNNKKQKKLRNFKNNLLNFTEALCFLIKLKRFQTLLYTRTVTKTVQSVQYFWSRAIHFSYHPPKGYESAPYKKSSYSTLNKSYGKFLNDREKCERFTFMENLHPVSHLQ